MIEVFKTNITERQRAIILVDHIHSSFEDYQANFDLHDCDNILRVKSLRGAVASSALIDFLQQHGCEAEVLPG